MLFIETFKDRYLFGPIIISSYNYDIKGFIRETKRFKEVLTENEMNVFESNKVLNCILDNIKSLGCDKRS
jgi:hypothetical protein